MAIGDAFRRRGRHYDDWIKKALPGYDELFTPGASLGPVQSGRPFRRSWIWGAGNGLFEDVLGRLSPRQIHASGPRRKALDVTGPVRGAGSRLPHGRLRTIEPPPTIRRGVSGLSIHHLDRRGETDLFGRIYRLLRDGGVSSTSIRSGPSRSRWRSYGAGCRARAPPGASRAARFPKAWNSRRPSTVTLCWESARWNSRAGFGDRDCV